MAGRDNIALDVDMKRFQEAMAKAPRKLAAGLKRHLGRFGIRFVSKFKSTQLTSALHPRTGALRRALTSQVKGGASPEDVELRIFFAGPGAKYAAIHEYGGTIRPKRGQYLTIPLQAAKTAAGVARGPARSFPNTFFLRSKAGNLFIARKAGTGIELLFLLRKSVTIRARMKFTETIRKSIPAVSRAFNLAAEEAFAA